MTYGPTKPPLDRVVQPRAGRMRGQNVVDDTEDQPAPEVIKGRGFRLKPVNGELKVSFDQGATWKTVTVT